jgi:hypothetical protein
VVIQYDPEGAAIVERPYREFLAELPGAVTVHVVCSSREAFDDLAGRIGHLACRLDPVITNHPQTCWSRDRWIALTPERPGAATTLLLPRGELGAGVWPQRAGDQRTGMDVAAHLSGHVAAERSPLYFDGGDFTTDGRVVFVTHSVARRNVQHTTKTLDDLRKALAAELKRKVVMLDLAPDHHAGMFMMFAGDGVILVGDPRLGRSCLSAEATESLLGAAGGADATEETQRRFDAVATQCKEAGYRVVRMPTVPAMDSRTYLTYLNAIIDQRDGKRTVYMPSFTGAESLNRAAADVWRSLGYDVKPIDCTSTYRHFGSLHCLVNVLRRDASKNTG